MLTPADFNELESEITRAYSVVESDIIDELCRFISKHETSTSIDEWEVKKLNGWQELQTKLLKIVKKDSDKFSTELEDIIKETVTKNTKSDDILLKAIKEYKEDKNLNTTITLAPSLDMETRVRGIMQNARMGINLTNTLAITSSHESFIKTVNEAFVSVIESNETLQKATLRATRRLAKDGIKVGSYLSNGKYYQMNIDSIVRRNLVTTVSQTCAKMTIENIQAYGEDLVKTSSHMGARPTHYVWQGKIFSLSGNNDKYSSLEEGTGYGSATGLCGCNCRHFFFPYVEGLDVTKAGLEKYTAEENEEKYLATQKQRGYERAIRSWRRVRSVGVIQKDSATVVDANEKISFYQSRLDTLCKENNIPRQKDREKI